MEYLKEKDYKEIEEILETFLENPLVIKKILKSLTLFLNSKNKVKIITKDVKITPKKIVDNESERMHKIYQEAEEAFERYSNRLRIENRKYAKRNRSISN